MTSADFETSALAVLRSLDAGEVVTYGEVAEQAGFPGAARAVGNLLRKTAEDVPWWRVVSASGHLRCRNLAEQSQRLRAEGIAVVDNRVRR